MQEFADERVYGDENAPNIIIMLPFYVSSMTKTLTIEWKDFMKFFYVNMSID